MLSCVIVAESFRIAEFRQPHHIRQTAESLPFWENLPERQILRTLPQ
jgi:hypothetical protein